MWAVRRLTLRYEYISTKKRKYKMKDEQQFMASDSIEILSVNVLTIVLKHQFVSIQIFSLLTLETLFGSKILDSVIV